MQTMTTTGSDLESTSTAHQRERLVLFFGNARPGEYNPFKQAGYQIGLFFRKNHYLPRPCSDDFAFIIDFEHDMELPPLLEAYAVISSDYSVEHHINVREDTVPQFAAFADALSIPSTSLKNAVQARDKTQMKAVFREKIGRHSTSAFSKISNESDLLQFSENASWPLVLKPTNLHASKFVSINENISELLESFAEATVQIDKLNQMDRNKDASLKAETFTSRSEPTHLQVEEFMQGTNHSVDCIIDKAGNVFATPVVDVLVGLEIGVPDFHHFARLCPSRLTGKQEQATREMAIAGCKALNLKSCIAHVELIYTKTGPQLIEVAARPGGNRAEILQLSYGFSLMKMFIDCLEGIDPPTEFSPLTHAAIVTPFPKTSGTAAALNFDGLTDSLPTLEQLTVKVRPGDQVGPAISGFTAPAYIWLRSDDAEAVSQDINQINNAHFFDMQ